MLKRMSELIEILNKANNAYYYQDKELISNLEYDRLYDELLSLENSSGIVLANSPTQNLGDHVYSQLPKIRHESLMLSLDKTKDPVVLANKLGQQMGVLSWKLDGLTVVLTYEDGVLHRAVTRGNGEIGEDVTENTKFFKNVPLKIPFKGKLILRGEAVISHEDFRHINELNNQAYKNARNLASASVRLLKSAAVKERCVQVHIFEVVFIENEAMDLVTERFNWIAHMGFVPVEYEVVVQNNILQTIQDFENRIEKNPLPSDGLVLTYESISYGKSLGTTGKFPRHSMAFKWKDEIAETVLREVRWQTSRTGVINPVAIFDTVELEGTEVGRATLNNVSFIKEKELGIGDTIEVYKANMIIPQVLNSTTKGNNVEIPKYCPECGGAAVIRKAKDSEILYCSNPGCPAKLINHLAHFCGRDAMNIRGLSKKTLEFLVDKGWVTQLIDLYNLSQYEKRWVGYQGYSVVSVSKYLDAIEASKRTNSVRFLYAMGIPKIGKSQARQIIEYLGNWNAFIQALDTRFDFQEIDGIGEQLNTYIYDWYREIYTKDRIADLAGLMIFCDENNGRSEENKKFAGKTFCITGMLHLFSNRAALVSEIEKYGGNVKSSVTSKTNYLINNDIASNSSKNKKAKELGVTVISEEDFMKL